MATVTHTTALPDSSEKTDFYALVDNATVTGIVNADVASTAAIDGSKLASITTAGKVDGSAVTNLANVPSGAGVIPIANVPTITTAKGGTGQDFSATAQGNIFYVSAAGVVSALAPGTAGQVLKTGGAAANPSWVNALSSVLDYGTSASASTSRQATALKFAYGNISIANNSSQAITNLTFTSSSTYIVIITYTGTATTITNDAVVNYDSGAQFTIKNNDGTTRVLSWLAIGI